MDTHIALLRGINVSGKNRLPMAVLRTAFESAGCVNVKTYIQSGNVVFNYVPGTVASLHATIADAILQAVGFCPDMIIIDRDQLLAAIQSNPFADAIDAPASLHFYFLAHSATSPDLLALEQARARSERYQLSDSVFFLHAPDGVARSKLATKVEKLLGVTATARNYRTVTQVAKMAAQVAGLVEP
jgi:uncharacterized protein (DUF1697 family)